MVLLFTKYCTLFGYKGGTMSSISANPNAFSEKVFYFLKSSKSLYREQAKLYVN